MFNKREIDSREVRPTQHTSAQSPDLPAVSKASSGRSTLVAVIGASIQIDGSVKGDEDLLIEGVVKGNVELKKHSVTIGSQGKVSADIYANTIFVDGSMEGNLIAAEQVVIRKSARIKGSITSPRVSLEDGARFNGSIDMDPQTETLKKAFGQRSEVPVSKPSSPVTADTTRPTKLAD